MNEKAIKHFCTINRHRWLVMKACFKVGLYKQGVLHDLSKYSWVEFSVGCKYYQGHRSPNNAEREENGVSLAWLHHKGRNKHHYEYWIDYAMDGKGGLVGMKMPTKYVVEMLVDRIAASKVYKGKSYKDSDPLEYFMQGAMTEPLMHPETKALLQELLEMLAKRGEKRTYAYIKREILS